VAHEPGCVGEVTSEAGRVNVDSYSQILPLFTAIAFTQPNNFLIPENLFMLGTHIWKKVNLQKPIF